MSLPEITSEQIRSLDLPTLKIRSEADLVAWKSTTGYHSYLLFLHRLTDSVVGCEMPQAAEVNPSFSPVCPLNMYKAYPDDYDYLTSNAGYSRFLKNVGAGGFLDK